MADKNEKQYASSFKIIQLSLYKIGEEHLNPYINLKQGNIGMATSLQYHEDIFWPCFGATLILTDNAENLIANMPIQGFEKVVLEVEDVLEERYSYEFRVWTVSNRIVQDRKQQYTLGLISTEGLVNEGTHINAKIKGNTSTVVEEILKDYLKVPVELIDTEPSATSVQYIPTKESPFALIRKLCGKTISLKTTKAMEKKISSDIGAEPALSNSDVDPKAAEKATGTAGYLFFQTRKGFSFKSIDKIISSGGDFEGDEPIGDKFVYQLAKIGEPSLYRIQEIVYGQEINMIKQLREGAFNSVVCFFNINTGEYDERVYKLADMWGDMAHMGSQDTLGEGQGKLSDYPTRTMSTIVNHENWFMDSKVASNESKHGGSGENQFPDWQKNFLQQGISRASTLFRQQLTVSLTGHLELCAGDKIDIRIPDQTQESQKEIAWDPENSGTYLIKNLNHQFLMGPTPSVYTVLELIRDSAGIKDQESKVK